MTVKEASPLRWRIPALGFIMLCLIVRCAPAVSSQENTATVYGIIYDLWNFEPQNNVVIEVYSEMALRIQTVSLDGAYSLELQPGAYTIRACHYTGSILSSYAEENVVLAGGENLMLDLILFPALENDENVLPESYDDLPDVEGDGDGSGIIILMIAIASATAGVAASYYVKARRRKHALIEKAERPVKVVTLPDDLRRVVDVIRESGGRINQVELREKLPYSEAKVSLMISDLEDRGLVRKIKKGRGNIIVLNE
ncbi:MAG: hypothetical protein QXG10_04400 [Candidatus Hadarchaeales archaeon]